MLDVEIQELENKTVAIIKTSCPRNFRNKNGEYDIDFITIKMFGNIVTTVRDTIKKDSIIGIKGFLSCKDETKPLEVIANSLTVLSSEKEAKKE